jgi:hypothetical protein
MAQLMGPATCLKNHACPPLLLLDTKISLYYTKSLSAATGWFGTLKLVGFPNFPTGFSRNRPTDKTSDRRSHESD